MIGKKRRLWELITSSLVPDGLRVYCRQRLGFARLADIEVVVWALVQALVQALGLGRWKIGL
ncbi:hypothetical protein A3A66_04660 [Microgenomates group bacterium RIFCSPLOWO2_01_FULL_46_13]|nr:MAG: hypothetical protein A2783_05135 [Microgenomates group bacterium RIFCSPHIGHO2_01_FULL_45_11]OGV94260.1 MAG: hypothetical protein A3A66_04660 [Microgenomates group bacterium RIFCSPLOWO2_01_FULL_46_13]